MIVCTIVFDLDFYFNKFIMVYATHVKHYWSYETPHSRKFWKLYPSAIIRSIIWLWLQQKVFLPFVYEWAVWIS